MRSALGIEVFMSLLGMIIAIHNQRRQMTYPPPLDVATFREILWSCKPRERKRFHEGAR